MSPIPAPQPQAHGVERTLGPLLIGVFFNAILYGVMVVQAYSYFQLPHRDNRWTRAVVIVLLIVETANTGFDFDIIWEALITDFGHPKDSFPTLLAADPIVTAFISAVVQVYLGWRIRTFTKSNLTAGFIFLLAFISLGAGATSSVLVGLFPGHADVPKYEWALTTWLTVSALCDVVISVSLIWFLVKYRKGSLDTTVSVVNKIILMTIQTGCITSIAAIADVMTFTFVKNATIQFIWDFSLSKLYTNCLLSTLNARAEWNRILEARNIAESVSDISFVHLEGVVNVSAKSSKEFDDTKSIESLRCTPNQLQSFRSQRSAHSIAISLLPPLRDTDSIDSSRHDVSFHHPINQNDHHRNIRPLDAITPPERKSSLPPS